MKIIILAAGKGERLMPLTRNTPKPLIELKDGMTLAETQLENMKKSGVIHEIVYVIGYLAEQIEAKIKYYQDNGYKIKTILNPFWSTTNNLVSLWLAKHEMDEGGFLVTNGDNIFTPDVFNDLIKNTQDGIFLTTIKKNSKYQDDDMKVRFTEKKTVAEVSKTIESKKIDAQSPGLVKISGKRYSDLFKTTLDHMVRKSEYLSVFWLEVFNELFKKGYDVNTFEIKGEKKWKEIDYHPDLKTLRNSLSEM